MSKRRTIAKHGWFEIRALAETSSAELLIYGDIGESWDAEESITAKKLTQELSGLKVDYLTVRINSYGGIVADGIAIHNAIRRHPSAVTVEIDSVAYSIASLIAMAGDTVRMADNALLMIHAPWGGAIGNAQDMRDMADTLDKYAEAMANAYVRTGVTYDQALAMLQDGKDHYFTADAALAAGFVDEVTEALPIAAHLDLSRFRNQPAAAAAFTKQRSNPMHTDKQPAAEPNPAEPVNVAEIEQAAQAKERQRIQARNSELKGIFNRWTHNAKVTAVYHAALADTSMTVDKARDLAMTALGEDVTPVNPQASIHTECGVDERDKRRFAMGQAVLARIGIEKHDGANQFRGMRLHELARACLESAGVNVRGMDMLEIAEKALTRHSVRGAQTTSDFPVLLENTMHKMVLTGFNAVTPVYSRFCKIGDVTDFRAWNRLVPGLIGNLGTVDEAGEYKDKAIPDAEKNSVTATRRGNIFQVTPEIIVNDDIGLIMDTMNGLGMAGPRTIDRAVITLVESNPTLSDGNALFSAAHGNFVGSGSGAAPSVATINAADIAMAGQTAPGDDAEYLDISPDIALAPRSLRSTFYEVLNAEFNDDSQKNQRKPNSVRNMISDVVATKRLTTTVGWYLFANPAMAPVIEVVFLNGQREPRVVEEENFRTSGLAVKVELPFGVGAIDYRGGYFNFGS